MVCIIAPFGSRSGGELGKSGFKVARPYADAIEWKGELKKTV